MTAAVPEARLTEFRRWRNIERWNQSYGIEVIS